MYFSIHYNFLIKISCANHDLKLYFFFRTFKPPTLKPTMCHATYNGLNGLLHMFFINYTWCFCFVLAFCNNAAYINFVAQLYALLP